MKSVKVVLVVRGKSKEGILKLRIIENRTKQTWKTLGVKIPTTYWNKDKSRVRATDKLDYKAINEKIEEIEKEYGNADNAVEKVKAGRNSFIAFNRSLIPELTSHGSRKKYNSLLKNLSDYILTINKVDLCFDDIDKAFVLRFRDYLLNDRNLSSNTTNRYLKHYKTIINKAIKAEVCTYLKHPFLNIPLERETTIDKYLTRAEVQKIIDFSPVIDKMKEVRLKFLFSIMGCGMRTSDLHLLTYGHVKSDRITYVMYKTKQKLSVKLNDNLKLLLAEKVIAVDEAKLLTSYKTFHHWYTEYHSYMNKKQKEMPASISTSMLMKWNEIKPSKAIDDRIAKQEEDKNDSQLKYLKHKLVESTGEILRSLSIKYPKTFVFKGLNLDVFKNFDVYTPLKKHFNQIESRTALYNKDLKLLQKATDIDLNLTSHVARHTYTNLMLEIGTDIYAISKSLNHQSIVATERYAAKFNSKVVDSANDNLAVEFPL
ncbi:site-specific integrase [Rufibacter sp. XAAS-G3-1]|uniref:tyrosine-type recombinase/integrase n=1 Tax=Rufibacter sp. XAAS-G3-1 TaxID=2729134 RepID=UPI0015E772CE|nr:site-specific integrase [Rufibacter sp. XAAS-G3-1]